MINSEYKGTFIITFVDQHVTQRKKEKPIFPFMKVARVIYF